MQSFVRTVTEENYENWIQESPDKNKVLLFTDRKSTAPLFKSLSKTYKEKLMFIWKSLNFFWDFFEYISDITFLNEAKVFNWV